MSCVPRRKISTGVDLSTRRLIFGSTAARFEAQPREVVERGLAVARHAAEHHGLAVVALLDADIKVAVAVAGDEELLQQLQRTLAVEPARRQVGLEVGQQILVDATEAAVVFALAPHRVVQNAQRLERLAEGSRAESRNAGERLRNVIEPARFRGGAVALRKLQHRLDGEDRVLEEVDARRVALGAGAGEAFAHLRETRVEAVADRGAEVGGEVEDDALLAERRAGGAARIHLGVGVQLGDLADRAREREALAVEERGRFALGAEHLLQADAGARLVGRPLLDEPRQERRPVGVATERVLLAGERVVEEGLDAGCHGCLSASRRRRRRFCGWTVTGIPRARSAAVQISESPFGIAPPVAASERR